MCELLPIDAKLNINEFEGSLGNAFTYERSFKVGLVSSYQMTDSAYPQPIATLEGCYLNEPFNVHIIG